MCSAVIKGFRFGDIQESCFEVRKRSLVGCSALLFGRFADSQELCFQVPKRSNMIRAILEVGRSADIHEFCFQAAKCSDMACVELHGGLFYDCQELHFQVSKRSDNCSKICKWVDLLIFTKSGFRVPKVEICAVLSSNEVDLLKLRNRVFSFRNVQI